jgi:hypothetical protein
MKQSQSAEYNSYRLKSGAQQFVQRLAVFTRNGDPYGAAGHTPG